VSEGNDEPRRRWSITAYREADDVTLTMFAECPASMGAADVIDCLSTPPGVLGYVPLADWPTAVATELPRAVHAAAVTR
jgi:hypothetical protein